ncbi:hypothetical protein CRENBAI_022337 [Crenichthys baileyi]|uniref:Uncharacterized protein n=1 Tax=Crenichthys baileyi TaxID=28760 RepID=A0AAV9RPZ8_9TELE
MHGRPFPLPSEMNDIEKAQRETSLAEWMNKMLQTKEIQQSSSLPGNSAPCWEGPLQHSRLQRDRPGSIRATANLSCLYRSQTNRRGSRGNPVTKGLVTHRAQRFKPGEENS